MTAAHSGQQENGGKRMNKTDYWQLFLETGAPELYLMYKATQTEEPHVSDHPGHRPQSHGLQ